MMNCMTIADEYIKSASELLNEIINTIDTDINMPELRLFVSERIDNVCQLLEIADFEPDQGHKLFDRDNLNDQVRAILHHCRNDMDAADLRAITKDFLDNLTYGSFSY